MKRLVVLTIAMLLIAAPLMAGNYLEDFESYSDGQQLADTAAYAGNSYGWIVGADSAMNGTQVVRTNTFIDAAGPVFSGVTFANDTVASLDLQLDPSNGQFFWTVANDTIHSETRSYRPYVGLYWNGTQLRYSNGGGFAWALTTGTIYAGDRYHFTADLDFTHQEVAYTITNLTDSARSFSFNAGFNNPTTIAGASNGRFYFGGQNVVYDNLAITTVPEPSSMLALVMGAASFGGFALRRRRA